MTGLTFELYFGLLIFGFAYGIAAGWLIWKPKPQGMPRMMIREICTIAVGGSILASEIDAIAAKYGVIVTEATK